MATVCSNPLYKGSSIDSMVVGKVDGSSWVDIRWPYGALNFDVVLVSSN